MTFFAVTACASWIEACEGSSCAGGDGIKSSPRQASRAVYVVALYLAIYSLVVLLPVDTALRVSNSHTFNFSLNFSLMDPVTLSAVIGAGSALAGGGIDMANAGRQNRASRKWALEQWNRQNVYNTPKAQMQRFKEAGLNPNLVYGRGDGGQAGPAPTPEFKAPESGRYVAQAGAHIVNAVFDLELKRAQTDNLKAQLDVIKEERALREAQTLATRTGTDRARFDLDFETEMRSISADARKAQLFNVRAQTEKIGSERDVLLARNIREAVTTSSNLQEAAQRIKGMQLGRVLTRAEIDRVRSSIDLMQKDGRLKQLDIELKEKGIQPTDPLFFRGAARLFEGLSDGTIHPWDDLKKFFGF